MNNIIKTTLLTLAVSFAASCSSFTDDSDPYKGVEPMKNLTGTWKITGVERNTIDITDHMDFSKFRLNLNADGTYTIDNYLPFVVKGNGVWKTDDPQYMYTLYFLESSSADTTAVEINYPISDGVRKLTMTLSPGCYSNKYTYTMEREYNQQNSQDNGTEE